MTIKKCEDHLIFVDDTERYSIPVMPCLLELDVYRPVNTIKVMSSMSVITLTIFLDLRQEESFKVFTSTSTSKCRYFRQ